MNRSRRADDELENLGLLIASARRSIKRAVLTQVSRHHLTAQQFWTLTAAHHEPGLGQGELAFRRRMDAPTASRVVTGLVRRKLIRVEPDAHDRRVGRIFLTPAGTSLARELSQVAQQIQKRVKAQISPTAIQVTGRVLRQITLNMDRFNVDEQPGRRSRRVPRAAYSRSQR